jgi:hypothetical protein
MKIIFLDNDGVICLSNNWGGRMKKWTKYRSSNPESSKLLNDAPVEVRFDDFDEKAIKILNEILAETGAEYVVSSDWRYHASLEELQGYYLSKGVVKAPIDVTPNTKDIDPDAWSGLRYRATLELERSIEIKHWLKHHSEVTHWVAIDDLNMSTEHLSQYFTHADNLDQKPGLANFVLTPRSNEGIKQSGIKEKILKYLL